MTLHLIVYISCFQYVKSKGRFCPVVADFLYVFIIFVDCHFFTFITVISSWRAYAFLIRVFSNLVACYFSFNIRSAICYFFSS